MDSFPSWAARARLRQEQPGRVQAPHPAAAARSEEHDLADDAVRHAPTAWDPAGAARLVERHVRTLLRRSEGATPRSPPGLAEPLTGRELEVPRLLARAGQTSASPTTWWWRPTRSKST